MNKEVRLMAEKQQRAQAASDRGDKHRITGTDGHQTEWIKTKKQCSQSSAVGSSYIPQNFTYVNQEEAKLERQN